jgi:HAD superfamily hydrolase (TIGR01509 family)
MNTLGSYSAVIFDMDGVIVDTEPRHERAFHEVVSEIGMTGRHSLRFEDYVGRTDRILWEDFVNAHQPAESLDDLLSMKRRKVVDIIRAERPLFVGVPDLVRDLAATVPLALASGSERPIVDEVLALDGLKDYFKVAVSGSEIVNGKPEPDIFLTTAGLLGVPSAECVVVEDSRPGVTAARAAGMRVIAITNTHPAADLGEATLVVTGCNELREALL